MAENLYACVYFASDKTVSVVPKSRCILQAEKHLLDKYAAHLHSFLKTAINQDRDFTTVDLIKLWHTETMQTDDSSEKEPYSPPKKKRAVSQSKTKDDPQKKKQNKDKAQQKRSMDASSMLAAQEIIAATQYNNVFPTVSTPQGHCQQQRQQKQQQQQPQMPQQPQLQQQQRMPQQLQQQQHLQKQQQQQQQLKQKIPEQQNQQKQNVQLPQKEREQLHQPHPEQRRPEPRPRWNQERTWKSVPQLQTPKQFNNQEILPPLTSLDQFIEEQKQRQQAYGNPVSLVSRDEARGLGATRAAFTSAMVTLSDYDDDFIDDDLERKPSLYDSGIGEDGTGNNEGSQNCNVNLSSEVVVLRKRITEIENENEQLKAQLIF
ncbi:vacuolar protein-sorting-associated protein 36-like [Montipora foliosa]|uniref:vacuolar protein-sorting-associated protein 36-like n=1 Tax=Montipora foliosa TaxID=591990 RepID=UPI0035F1306E